MNEAMPLLPLIDWVDDAKLSTVELVADLTDDQLLGPPLPTLNPLLWELGHVAWFQEKWALRHARKRKPFHSHSDALYDSAAVPHDRRWSLPLPSREWTLHYLSQVRDGVLEELQRREPTTEEIY